jgi:hypothetical protein
VLDTPTLSCIMDANLAPGVIIQSVMAPAGTDRKILVRLATRNRKVTSTFSLKPGMSPAEMRSRIFSESHRLGTSGGRGKRAAGKSEVLTNLLTSTGEAR